MTENRERIAMVRKMLSSVAWGAAVLSVWGCTSTKPVVAPPEVPGGGPVIAHVRSQKHFLTIHASGDGPRFSVATAGGRLVAASLSEQELESRFPHLAEDYRSSLVDSTTVPSRSITPR